MSKIEKFVADAAVSRALVGKSERTLSRAEMAELQGWDISTVPDDVSPHPRPVKAVRGRGRMVNNAYVPENFEWQDVLCDGTVGRDPMSIPPETLTAAGHPPRRTAAVIGAMGDVHIEDGIVRCKDLRRQCLSCAENAAEVRRCFIYNCPIWPYRMGHNPHDPRRGVDPFEKASTRRKDPLRSRYQDDPTYLDALSGRKNHPHAERRGGHLVTPRSRCHRGYRHRMPQRALQTRYTVVFSAKSTLDDSTYLEDTSVEKTHRTQTRRRGAS